ncbi:MAG: acyl-CoA dehydrogenase family protein, partial [Gemmatimonas sp.]
MADTRYLSWPFFAPAHATFARTLDRWAAEQVADIHSHDTDGDCRTLVRLLGEAGWLTHVVAGTQWGGAAEVIDTRAICLARETLARHNGLADFAFAMQGLGSGAISLAGTPEQQGAYLPRVARGDAIAAFALSEPTSGSDAAALQCAAQRDDTHYVLNGEKTWISNG